MTLCPRPVPAWAVLAASGCLSPALPQVMFLQRKGQVIMTIELLDTEEAQTEDPVEVQVGTAALHSEPRAPRGPGAATGSIHRVAPAGHAQATGHPPGCLCAG